MNRRRFFLAATATLAAFGAGILPAHAAPPVTDDARPVVDDTHVKPETVTNAALPTLWIVGDSTLKSNAPLRGWGDEIAPFFDKTKINVVNRAIGGRSSKTFQTEGRWAAVVSGLKPGDFVLVQFGHNDVGRYDDPGAKGRPSLHSEGDETATAPKPDGTTETIHSFGWYMRRYGSDTRAKGATAVFCSMVPHKDWTADNKIRRGERASFVQWTANAAKATGNDYIDLNEIIAEGFEKLGPAGVEPLFGDKRTHSTPAGAAFNARCVVEGLRGLPGSPFDRFLSPAGNEVTPLPAFVVGAPPATTVK